MDKRLFSGTIVTIINTGFAQNVHADSFVGWFETREQALGSWFEIERKRHPSGNFAHHYCDDITHIAKEGTTNGAF
jgi:hypothetical protein